MQKNRFNMFNDVAFCMRMRQEIGLSLLYNGENQEGCTAESALQQRAIGGQGFETSE